MKSILKIQSIALVFLLICSVCVVPVMAGDKQLSIVEDGVHLIKSDGSPTVLSPSYANKNEILVGTNFVVDGNQYYWVRIGSVKASTLSTNNIAKYVCMGGIIIGGAVAGAYAGAAVASSEIVVTSTSIIFEGAAGGATAVSIVQKTPKITNTKTIDIIAGSIAGLVSALTSVCDHVASYFVDVNFRYTDTNGCILLKVDKNNQKLITELKTSDIDITKLTHLSSDGKIVPKLDL